ncbi:hypothetical protein LTR17_012393 [Elasticomyces elasticus]|nr:hypothetical protein LTR17_012393 [Elasticomyces elasticus]
MTTSQATSQAPKGFFRLPAELRNRIYELVLGDTDNSPAYVPWQVALKHQPGLLEVCKQIRNEALPLYYKVVFPIVECTADAMDSFNGMLTEPATLETYGASALGFVFICGTEGHSMNRFEEPHCTLLLLKTPNGESPWKVTLQHGYLGGTRSCHPERRWKVCTGNCKLYGKAVPQFWSGKSSPSTVSKIRTLGAWRSLPRPISGDSRLSSDYICSARNDLKVLQIKLQRIVATWANDSFKKQELLPALKLIRLVAANDERRYAAAINKRNKECAESEAMRARAAAYRTSRLNTQEQSDEIIIDSTYDD